MLPGFNELYLWFCLAFLFFTKFCCPLCTSRPEPDSSPGSDLTQGREKESAEGILKMRGTLPHRSSQGLTKEGEGPFSDSGRPAVPTRPQDSPNSRVEFACLVTEHLGDKWAKFVPLPSDFPSSRCDDFSQTLDSLNLTNSQESVGPSTYVCLSPDGMIQQLSGSYPLHL